MIYLMDEPAANLDEAGDVALLLVDLCVGWRAEHGEWLAALRGRGTPVIVVGTKADRAPEDAPWPPPEADEALRMGLVDEVADDPDAAALAWFESQLAPRSASAIRSLRCFIGAPVPRPRGTDPGGGAPP